MTIDRRTFLKTAAGIGAAAALPMPFVRTAGAADTIKLAALYDLSGGLEVSGKPMLDTLNYAVGEINAAGGLLGKQVEVVTYDTQSAMQMYGQYAQQAALKDRVAVVHGGITSASREVIRPVLDKYKTLYFYDTPYEGGVCDRNIFCPSTTPGQTVDKLVAYALKKFGKKVYTLAANYNYGQITADWVKKYAKDGGGEVVGTEFFPLDAADFSATISKIQAAKPDWVMAVLVGGGTISFYRQFAAAGLGGKIGVASTTFGGNGEQLVLSPKETDGIAVCYNYMETIQNPENAKFLDGFHKKFGAKYTPLYELPMSSYQGVHLWAAGVRKAGSTDRMAVIKALETGIAIDMPSGKVTVDPTTHHCILNVYLAEFHDGGPKVVQDFPQQKPTDTEAVCNLKDHPNDRKQYVIKV
ncbi:MAG TPA: ABC transporter substrate-binding protein [Hyphomicrobiales bacterium]|nr:ABC transporter substrate-binding protein [Hyphomicrobiales bacterium]